jgi:hypothetical protein
MQPERIVIRTNELRNSLQSEVEGGITGAFASRTPRFNLDVPSLLTFPSGRTRLVRLRNLSADGFMAETSEWLQVGTSTLLDLPAVGAVEIEVTWQMGGRFGGIFAAALTSSGLFAAGLVALEQGRA